MADAMKVDPAVIDRENILGIVKFQALYRGHRTRKALQQTRNLFKSILADLEDDSNDESCIWPSRIGRPIFLLREEVGPVEVAVPKLSDSKTTTLAVAAENTPHFSDNCSKPLNIDDSKTTQENLRSMIHEIINDVLVSPSSCPIRPLAKQNTYTETNTEVNSTKNICGTSKLVKHKQTYQACSPVEGNVSQIQALKKKKEIQMEILWIQQAIDSRKQYIKLKG